MFARQWASDAAVDSVRWSSQFENNYFTRMRSVPEAGSYYKLVDFAYHLTLGLRVIKKKKKME